MKPASCEYRKIQDKFSSVLHVLTIAASAVLSAALLLAMSACASVQVKLGWKVYLDRTPVQSIQASLPDGPAIAPGKKSALVVRVAEPDGKVLTTEGKGGGKVMWSDLQVTATAVTVNKKGVLSLAKDPRVSDGKLGHVTITVPSHPDLRAELDIPFRYDIAFSSNFSGSKGSDGMNGTDGIDGTPGSPGSTDPNNPSAGGDGGNGTDGSNGQDGGSGGDAPPVEVQVALQAGNQPLLQVALSAAGKKKFYLVDPKGGSLTVHSDGGAGGSGGRGGRGGRGGSGGIGSPNGSSGRDGMDGRNGWDGSQGRGGAITVTYDPQAKPYLTVIHLSSQNGPAAVMREQTLTALW